MTVLWNKCTEQWAFIHQSGLFDSCRNIRGGRKRRKRSSITTCTVPANGFNSCRWIYSILTCEPIIPDYYLMNLFTTSHENAGQDFTINKRQWLWWLNWPELRGLYDLWEIPKAGVSWSLELCGELRGPQLPLHDWSLTAAPKPLV